MQGSGRCLLVIRCSEGLIDPSQHAARPPAAEPLPKCRKSQAVIC